MPEAEYSGLDPVHIAVSLNARKGRPRRFTPEELASPVKHCRTCNTVKPKTDFGIHRRYKDGLQAFCKECINARARQRRQLWSPGERERRRALGREYWRKRKDVHREWRYGITGDEYRAMWEQQRGRCAICGDEEICEGRDDLCVDHDHRTGQVRALLCMRCNTALGGFLDRADLVAAALEYLERFSVRAETEIRTRKAHHQ